MAFASLLAGCGSGGGGVSVRDFQLDAERICAQGNQDAYDLRERLDKAREEPDRATFFATTADVIRDSAATARPYLQQLAGLERPADDDERLEAWLADQRRRLDLLDRLATAYDRRDEASIAGLAAQVDELEQRLSAFARSYGVRQCAAAAS